MHNEYLNNPVNYLPRIRITAFIMTSDILISMGLDSAIFDSFML